MYLSKEEQGRVREHLTKILHNFSDADSSILSDYIVALLAKEGHETQIRDDCESELSAFMNDKTSQFVDQLFLFINSSLKNKSDKKNGSKSSIDKPRTYKRKVVRGNKDDVITISRDANDISKQQNNGTQQHDFVVSSTPTPPNKPSKSPSPHKSNGDANHNGNYNKHRNPNNNNNNNNSYSNHRRRNKHNNNNNHNRSFNKTSNNGTTNNTTNNLNGNANTNLQALQQLLGLVQQNLANAQNQSRYQSQNKAFTTRRQLGGGPINPLTSLTQFVPRPIIQPTPNIIQTQTQTQTQNSNNNGSTQLQQNGNHNNNGNNILDKPLDEIRLPPNNNPFYQDDRFNTNNNNTNNINNLHQSHGRKYHHNKYVGKKRNFSKMSNNGNKDKNDGNSNSNSHTKKKPFETEFNEKRQLYVYNIPSHLNTMTRLTSHFQQFGDIQHIQVHREMNKAYVQFSSHDEALEALNHPDPILNETSIQTSWAHFNRRDFERNAKHNNSNSKNHRENSLEHKSNKSKSTSPTINKNVSREWVSKEYKQKLTAPPKKKQKISNGSSLSSSKATSRASSIPKKAEIKIPKDVSDNIKKLQKNLTETLKMYETLEKKSSDKDAKDSGTEELKNSLKKTIEAIENQMGKLIEHQKKRNEVIKKVEESKKAKIGSRRGRGRGRGYYRRGRGRGYGMMYNPMMMMMGGRGGGMYWRGRGGYRGGARYIVRKPRNKGSSYRNKHNKKQKADLSGKSIDYRTSSLLVENLPDSADEAELRIHFLKFGEVETIDLFPNNKAKVDFKKRADAEKALLKGKEFKSETLKLKFCDNDDLILLSNSNINEQHDDDDDNDQIITFGGVDHNGHNEEDEDDIDIDEEDTENVNMNSDNKNNDKLKVYDGLPEINGKANNSKTNEDNTKNGDAIEVDE